MALIRGLVLAVAGYVSFGPLPALLFGAAALPAAALEAWAQGASAPRRILALGLTWPLACAAVPAALYQGVYAWLALERGPGEAARVVADALPALPADPRGEPFFQEALESLPWYVDATWQPRGWCLLATGSLAATVLGLGVACRLFVRAPRGADPRAQLAVRGLQAVATAAGAAALGLLWFALAPEPPGDVQLRSLQGIEQASQLWGVAVVLGAGWPVGAAASDLFEERRLSRRS